MNPMVLTIANLTDINLFLLELSKIKRLDQSEDVVKKIYQVVFNLVKVYVNDINGDILDREIEYYLTVVLKLDLHSQMFYTCKEHVIKALEEASEILSDIDLVNSTIFVNKVTRTIVILEVTITKANNAGKFQFI